MEVNRSSLGHLLMGDPQCYYTGFFYFGSLYDLFYYVDDKWFLQVITWSRTRFRA